MGIGVKTRKGGGLILFKGPPPKICQNALTGHSGRQWTDPRIHGLVPKCSPQRLRANRLVCPQRTGPRTQIFLGYTGKVRSSFQGPVLHPRVQSLSPPRLHFTSPNNSHFLSIEVKFSSNHYETLGTHYGSFHSRLLTVLCPIGQGFMFSNSVFAPSPHRKRSDELRTCTGL